MKSGMKAKTLLLAVILALAGFILTPGPSTRWVGSDFISQAGGLTFVAQAGGSANYVPGQVVCEVSPGVNIYALASQLGMTVLDDLEDNLFLLGLPPLMTVGQAVSLLKATPGVVLAEPNYLAQSPEVNRTQRSHASVGGSPSNYYGQYALQLIRATQAQAIADGGGVTVAVIDTGVDTSHPAFHLVAPGYDFADDDNDPTEECCGDAYGHGTMVAGVVAAVAPGATILPVRAFDANGVGAASNIGKAIRYAVRQGSNVLNLSFGLTTQSAPIQKAIDFAWQQEVVLIAAAGNGNTSAPQYPASDDLRVLAVAATDQNDVKAGFSNYGSHIDVSAPGVSIYSAYPGGSYASWEGTSFSAPFVSGEAALVLSHGSGDAGQVIQDTAVNIDALNPGYRGLLGRGRIDALAAVSQ
jgi:thermitase